MGFDDGEEYSESEEGQYFVNLRDKLEEVLDSKKVNLREAEKKFLLRFIPHIEYDGKACAEFDGECIFEERDCPISDHRNLTDLLQEVQKEKELTPEMKKYHASLVVQAQLMQTIEYPLRSFDNIFKEMRDLLALQPVDGVRAERIEVYRDVVLGVLDIDQYCNKYRAVKMSAGHALIEGEFEAARTLCAVLADDIRDYLRENVNIHFETDENLCADLELMKKEAIDAVLLCSIDEVKPERRLAYFNRARDIVKVNLLEGFDDLALKQIQKKAGDPAKLRKKLADYSWVEKEIAHIQNGGKDISQA